MARQWHRGTVALPKGRKTRMLPVSARLDALLWEHRKQTKGADGDLIFVGDLGARVNQGNLRARVLRPACVAAGVGEMVADEKGKLRPETWVTWHTFRHTCASQLFRNGWNAAQVSRFLGHADAGFTLRTYVHLLDEDLPEPDVLASLDEIGENAARDSAERITDGSAEAPETGRNAESGETRPIPLPVRETSTGPRPADVANSDYESAALTS